MFIQQSLTTIISFILKYKKEAENVSPFPGSGEDKVSHYAGGQGEYAASGASVVLKHHLISWITIMLLAVLISH